MHAQDAVVNVSVRRPVPLSLSTWRTDPSVVTVSVTATRDLNNFVIGFEILNTTTGQSAHTDNAHACMPVFSIRRGETRVINGPQLICNNAINADPDLQRSVASAGAIPEGDYSYCVHLIESDRRTEISTTGRLCDYFTIVWPNPPVLIYPVNIFDLNVNTAQTFTWQPALPLAPGTSAQYRIRVVGVVDGQEARTALDAATASETVLDEFVPTTSKVFTPNFAPFVDLIGRSVPRFTRFAWQIQVVDQYRMPIATRGGTQGKSEIGLFDFTRSSSGGGGGSTAGASCVNPMTLTAYFPAATDTIPWLPPHLIVQWGPWCSEVRNMQYTLHVRERGGSALTDNSRDLNWRSGILSAQGLSAGQEDRARLIITNWRTESGSVAPLNASLRRGPAYDWNVDAQFVRSENGAEQTRTANTSTQSFSIGLKMPVNPEPANNATVDDGSNLSLLYDIPAPAQSMYTPNDLMNVMGRGSASMDFGIAYEVVRVKVSRNRDMSSAIASQTTVSPRYNIVTGDNPADLFGRKRMDHLNLSAGTYYWQVEYCNPEDTNRIYRQGPVWQFNIGGSPIDPRECFRIQPVAPENRATISGGPHVRFSISTNPPTNLNAVRGGRLQIWEMASASEDPATVKGRPALVDERFSGHEAAAIVASSGIGSSSSRSYYNLPFVNGSAPYRFEAHNNTTYLWVFTMQVDGATIRNDGQRCTLSEISSSDGIFTYREGCSDACIAAAPSSTTPSSRTFNIGDDIRVGQFTAHLTRVSGTGSSLSGAATVNIPVFRGGVQVEFNNIQVNDEAQMFEGEMRAVQAPSSPINASVANDLGTALGLTSSQVTSLHGIASDATRLVSNLAMGTPVNLPIGFDRVIEGQRVVIGIIGMVFKPREARLNAALSFPMPAFGPGERIGFGARNICFYPGGFGRDFDIGLVDDLGYTASDTSWSFHFLAPREASGSVRADSGTFARFGCNGFEFIRVKAEVNFPRTWIKKVETDGSVNETDHAKATFTTLIRASGEFIAEATMDKFTPAGAPDFVMECDTIVLDFSDHDNPSTIHFPERYRGSTDNTWRGFYMHRLFMQLPSQLRTFSEDRPMKLGIQDMIIDRTGLSLSVRLENVIQYPRGNFGEWGASIDTIGVDLVSSSLERGFLSGRFQIPISDSALDYSAVIARAASGSGVEFRFNIRPRDTINARLWVAQLTLDPTSYIRLTANSARFQAEANFSGALSIVGDVGSVHGVRFGGISFQNFHIQSVEPYVRVEHWSFASPQHGFAMSPSPEPSPDESSGSAGSGGGVSGFPVSIGNINIVSRSASGGLPGLGIQFTLSVNLQPGNNAISGGATFSIWSKVVVGSGPMHIDFDGFQLDSVGIHADFGAVIVNGQLRIYNQDPTFGDGFRGSVQANFVHMVEISATIQFGSVHDYRYWYVDARAVLATGIPVFPGVGFYGFGGGAWYNMRRVVRSEADARRGIAQTGSSDSTDRASSAPPGATNSGERYEPFHSDAGESFGFYAMVTMGTMPKSDAFNCDVRLEISFIGGAINEIRLRGDGYMLADVMHRPDAKVTIVADIYYNFPDRIFHGDFDVTINAAVVTGHGHAVMHFAPTTWYIKVGDPEREKIHVTIADLVEIQAYLMCGLDLPNTMVVPPEVVAICGMPPAARGMEQLSRGDGFAFGASASMNVEARFLIFYASVQLLFGFDVSLMNYGSAARCEGTGAPMGVNGWYARGQLYARLGLAVGIDVDLGFVSGRYEILSAEIAAILQAGLPNPTWMSGAFGGRYSILGGLISGSFNFQFKVGEECRLPVESGLSNIDLINEISPANGSTDVSIGVEPAIASNFLLERPFEILELDPNDGNTYIRTYRVRIREFRLNQEVAGAAVACLPARVDANDRHYAILSPSNVLRPNRARYTATATVYGQRFDDAAALSSNDISAADSNRYRSRISAYITNDRYWINAMRQGGSRRGEPIAQTVSSTFTTETLPDSLRPSDVYLAYPRNRQRHYLQGECPAGSINLMVDRSDLFYASRGLSRYEYKVRYVKLPGNVRTEASDWSYAPGPPPLAIGERPVSPSRMSGGYISYTIPSLENNTIYAVQIIRRKLELSSSLRTVGLGAGNRGTPTINVPASTLGGSAIANIGLTRAVLSSTIYARLGNTVSINATRISGFNLARQVADNENLLYLYFFKTSRHNTLEQKVNSINNTATNAVPPFLNMQLLNAYFSGPELVDPADVEDQTIEVSGRQYLIHPLISVSARTRGDEWHSKFTEPQIYNEFTFIRSLLGSSYRYQTMFDRIARTSTMATTQATANPLQDYEISAVGDPSMQRQLQMLSRIASQLRYNPVPGGGVSGMGLATSAYSEPSGWKITYEQPVFIPFDFGELRTRALALISMYCGGGDVGFTPQECAHLRRIANQSYVLPLHGQYSLSFKYDYYACLDPDSPMRSFTKRFTY